jgi:hypothetical protein
MAEYPQLLPTVLDTTDVRQLAEFYRELLGLRWNSADGCCIQASMITASASAGRR